MSRSEALHQQMKTSQCWDKQIQISIGAEHFTRLLDQSVVSRPEAATIVGAAEVHQAII